MGNGKCLAITHTGSTTLPTNHKLSIKINNVLIVSDIKKKKIVRISKLTYENQVIVEFHRDLCVVKDLRT